MDKGDALAYFEPESLVMSRTGDEVPYVLLVSVTLPHSSLLFLTNCHESRYLTGLHSFTIMTQTSSTTLRGRYDLLVLYYFSLSLCLTHCFLRFSITFTH